MARARHYQNENAQLLSELIRITSLSSHEKDAIEFVAGQFHKAGASVEIDPMGNMLAFIGEGKPFLAFDGHIDTVDIGDANLWKKNPYSGEISSGMVYGRGASDQKGGIAAMLTALKIILESDHLPQGKMLFVCSVQEEDCDGLCWQYIINEDGLKPDLVILTEPTDGKINRGQRGRMEMEVHTAGISCHGSAPERGENAIYKLAPILLELQELNNKLAQDDFLGKGTLTATKLYSSSPSLCAVADGAAVHLDRRLTAGETKLLAVEEILNLPSAKRHKARVDVLEYSTPSWKGLMYKTEKYLPTWTLDENHPALLNAVDCYAQLFAKPPVIDKWTFSTNGVATKGMFDIPTFGFGPGYEHQAHAPNEYCPIEHLTACAAFYAAFSMSFGQNYFR